MSTVHPKASGLIRVAIGELIDRVERHCSSMESDFIDERLREELIDELVAEMARVLSVEDGIDWIP